jgi:protein SCO1/2
MLDATRRLRCLLSAVVLALGCAFAQTSYEAPTATSSQPLIGGHFSLVTLDGKRVTENSFRGKWQLIYFGYTFCPDVCPTQLSEVGDALDQLGSLAKRLQPIFVTVDPARDSAKEMTAYLKAFDPRILGLRGDPDEIEVVAKDYRVYYRARALGDGTYAIDHSSFLYVLNPQGKFVEILAGNMPGHKLADMLRKLVK